MIELMRGSLALLGGVWNLPLAERDNGSYK